jgi:hypothetical protein
VNGKLRGGQTTYGHALGILMLDTKFPRIQGDVGHAETWPFPVLYHVVKGAKTNRIMGSEPDPDLIAPFLAGARALEGQGVRAITTSCGFLAVFQRELAAAVSVPVVTSSLLQVPFVAKTLKPEQKVCIVTERPHLTERHFAGVGWSSKDQPAIVAAMPESARFPKTFIDDSTEADAEVLESDVVETARTALRNSPEIGAFVLECTNFVPFSQAVRAATNLPVFDLYTMVMQVYLATTGRAFPRGGLGAPWN